MNSFKQAERSIIVSMGTVRRGALLVAVGVSVGLLSCADSNEGTTRAGVDAPARHAIHNDQLQADMRDLEHRSKEDIAAEIYTGSPVQTNLQEVGAAAEAIAKTADHIPDYLGGIDWTPDERRQFLALAQQLGAQARTVQAQARTGNARKVRHAVDRMNATCDACHTQFRFNGS